MGQSLPVRVQTDQFGEVSGLLDSDLDAGTLAIAANQARPVGSALLVRLVQPSNGQLIPAFCKVVGHRAQADGSIGGLDLQLPANDAALTQRLRALVQELEQGNGEQSVAAQATVAETSTGPAPIPSPAAAAAPAPVAAPISTAAPAAAPPPPTAAPAAIAAEPVGAAPVAAPAPAPSAEPELPEIHPEALEPQDLEHHDLTAHLEPEETTDLEPADLTHALEAVATAVRVSMKPMGDFDGELTTDEGGWVLRVGTTLPQGPGSQSTVWIHSPAGGQLPVKAEVMSSVAGEDGKQSALEMRLLDVAEDFDEKLHAILDGISGTAEAPAEEAEPEIPVQSAQELAAGTVPDNWADQLKVFERSGRIKEAVELLRNVVNTQPMNVNLHVKVAELAISIGNFKLAQWHAQFAANLDQNDEGPKRVFTKITERQNELHAKRAEAVKAKARAQSKMAPRSRSGNRTLMGIIATLVVLGTGAYNVWEYAIPHVEHNQLQPGSFRDIVPTMRALIYEKRLYVTTDDSWFKTPDSKKREIMGKLQERAKQHGVSDVVLSDTKPSLLALVRKGQIQIYR